MNIEEQLREKGKFGILVLDIDLQTWSELSQKYEVDDSNNCNNYINLPDALEICKDLYTKEQVEELLRERDENRICKNCKYWNEEQGQCNNDIVWLNKPANIFLNISDLKTNWRFGCVKFEEKP